MEFLSLSAVFVPFYTRRAPVCLSYTKPKREVSGVFKLSKMLYLYLFVSSGHLFAYLTYIKVSREVSGVFKLS